MKGSISDPAINRRISLTCLCCNAMEHIAFSHIVKYLRANNILLDSQHGFREKLSSVIQLIFLIMTGQQLFKVKVKLMYYFFILAKLLIKLPIITSAKLNCPITTLLDHP